MRYLGKILGFILGLFSGTGLLGLIVGLIVGHIADTISHLQDPKYFLHQKKNKLFLHIIFQVMGFLTKSKGKVTHTDIKIVSAFMDQMKLYGEERFLAQQAFREGKLLEYPLREKLRTLRNICLGRFDLVKTFLEIQIHIAFSDGILHPNEKKVLYIIAEELGFSKNQFNYILNIINQNKKNYTWSNSFENHDKKDFSTLDDAYYILGVKKTDDNITIKRKYRKLMSKNHPDKLIAQGLSKDNLKLAQKKTQKIQLAYDLIKKEKNIK